MVEKVEGYMTNDHTFFKTEREAKIYEARVALEAALREDDMSFDVIEWINRRRAQILEYLNAERNIPSPKITRT